MRILGPRTHLDKTPPGLQVAEAHIWGLQIHRGEAEQPDQAGAPFLSHRSVEDGAGRREEPGMQELPGRSWLEGSDQTWLLGVSPPRDWGRGDRSRQRGTDRDPRRRARARGDACKTEGVSRVIRRAEAWQSTEDAARPGGGSRCHTRHTALLLASSLMRDESCDFRPTLWQGRDRPKPSLGTWLEAFLFHP